MIGYIYKYTNVFTGKSYIGQTINLINRKAEHKRAARTIKNKFYNSVNKYGWSSFIFTVLAKTSNLSKEEVTPILDLLEISFIAIYNSYLNGYNSTKGGHSARGMKRSEAYKEYCRNRVYTTECRSKMSLAAKNRKVTEETREKLREAAINRNFAALRDICTDKRNKGISKALSKPVLQIKDGKIINKYDSLKDAVEYIKTYIAPKLTIKGIQRSLCRHCKCIINKPYYGFIWIYESKFKI